MKSTSILSTVAVAAIVLLCPTPRKTKDTSNAVRSTYEDLDLFQPNGFSVKTLERAGVDFPVVHAIIIPFIESSFCKEGTEDSPPTLCASGWDNVIYGIDPSWSPHNYSGMKMPTRRPTTAICSLGEFIRQKEAEGFTLNPKFAYLRNDPHAVYKSDMSHAKDIRLWQEYVTFLRPAQCYTAEDYFNYITAVGYNENPSKYLKKLKKVYSQYLSGELYRKYERYYNERMNLSLGWSNE